MSDTEPDHQQNSEIQIIVNRDEFTIELQNYYSRHNKNSKKLQWTNQRLQSVIKLLNEYNIIKAEGRRPTSQHYHFARKYDVQNIGNQKILIMKRKDISDPVVQIIPTEEYYQKILDAHIATGHGRRDKIVHALKNKYVVPIFAVSIFLNLCKICILKKTFPKKRTVVKPLISDEFNRRGQIDLVDFQTSPDQEYKWLLQYQDHLTKFCLLRPLKSKQAKEVAIEILKIFLEIGCPHILQSNNGHEFTASVLKEIVSLWSACKILSGKPRYPQCQESIKCSNQDIKNLIQAWMKDNKSTNWSIGCYFVQFQINSSYNSTIARTPYKALFGEDPTIEISSTYLSKNIISKLENEEDLQKIIEENNNNKKQNSEKEEQKVNAINISKPQKIKEEQSQEIIMLEQIKIEYNPELYPASHENLPQVKEVIYKPHNKNSINSEKQEKLADDIDKEIITLQKDIALSVLPCVGDSSKIITERKYLMCKICNKVSSGAHSCIKCKNIIHAICGVVSEGHGSQMICNLCVNECNIIQKTTQSHINLKRAADKMISTSSKKFKSICTGSTVLVDVPKVDRGPLDSKNLIGKVLMKKTELYQVGTAFGIIKD